MTEHDHSGRRRPRFIQCERASEYRRDSEQREHPFIHAHAAESRSAAVHGQRELGELIASEIRQIGGLPDALHIVIRNGRAREVALLVCGPDEHEFVGLRVRHRLQDDGVHNAEDRGICADADAQRQNSGR